MAPEGTATWPRDRNDRARRSASPRRRSPRRMRPTPRPRASSTPPSAEQGGAAPVGGASRAELPMADFDLERFVAAQQPIYRQVERELGRGEKKSHWMWFVFPQIAGLGS